MISPAPPLMFIRAVAPDAPLGALQPTFDETVAVPEYLGPEGPRLVRRPRSAS